MRPPDWPDHMIERRGYYSWRHPVSKKEYGLGRDYAAAARDAREANASLTQPALAERIEQTTRTLGQFLEGYQKRIDAIPRPNSRDAARSELKAIRTHLSDLPIGVRFEDMPAISKACFDMLQLWVEQDKLRMAKCLRTRLIDIFGAMVGQGWLAVNPAKDLELPAVKVKRDRLTWEAFQAIYAVADTRTQRSMELGLLTAQRLEEVANMRFRDVRDGFLHVEQQKTGTRLRIPTSMRLNALGLSLDDVIKRCRDNVVSQNMIHHYEHNGRAKPGHAVNPQTVSTLFREARIRAGITAPEGRRPPSFHELRSLSIRLYTAEGYDPQALAGHKDAATTAIYADARGAEWIEVKAR